MLQEDHAHLHGLIGGTGGHPLPVEVVRHIVDQILVVCLQRCTSIARNFNNSFFSLKKEQQRREHF
jgi:hypothetical protein